MKTITTLDLKKLLKEAGDSPRKRANFNLHNDGDDISFFYNALWPEAYLRPHKHEDKDEYFQIIEGEVFVITFNEDGSLREVIMLKKNEVPACKINYKEWHTLVPITPSIILEAQAGPYDPKTAKIFAPWSPEEEAPEKDFYKETLIKQLQKAYPRY